MKQVAVIDVGSNTIKALVARQTIETPFEVMFEEVEETRISRGISQKNPSLLPENIQAGVNAIGRLWKQCKEHGPIDSLRIVATSAVRDARNGNELVDAVRKLTGIKMEVLTGKEEAEGIGLGVVEDPQFKGHWRNYTCFDLGGGSAELIRFQDGQLQDWASLPLGAVRLTEAFIPNPADPVAETPQTMIADAVDAELQRTHVALTPPIAGTGGGLLVTRAMLAARAGQSFEDFGPILPKAGLLDLEKLICSRSLEERTQIPGLPRSRADILPAALILTNRILHFAAATEIHSSRYNLRYGLAYKLLQ